MIYVCCWVACWCVCRRRRRACPRVTQLNLNLFMCLFINKFNKLGYRPRQLQATNLLWTVGQLCSRLICWDELGCMIWTALNSLRAAGVRQHLHPGTFGFYRRLSQRQEGHTQRFIREVNTTSRSCVLWDLEEETDYIIQVQSIGLYGESQASKKVHFRTLKKSDRFPSNSSNQGKPFEIFIKPLFSPWKDVTWHQQSQMTQMGLSRLHQTGMKQFCFAENEVCVESVI